MTTKKINLENEVKKKNKVLSKVKAKKINPKKDKIKLLIGSDCYLPRWDGVSKFLDMIIPQLQNDYDISLIAPKFKGKYKKNKQIDENLIPVGDLNIGDYVAANLTSKYKKIIDSKINDSDLVWVQTIGPIGSYMIKKAEKLKKPVIAYIHSIDWELVSRSINKPILRNVVESVVIKYVRNLYNKCMLLIVPSRTTGDVLQWKKIYSDQAIIPLGIDTDVFSPTKDKDAAKMALNISPRRNVIGFVGRIAYEKNLTTLVRAFIRIKDEFPDAVLLIVGDGISELKEKFSKVNGIKLVGSTDDVVPYLHAMDAYVLPSLTETTSLSTIEAMSCGVPVIVTPVGDVKYYIKNNVNGLKFKKENSFELSVKLRKLLKNEYLKQSLSIEGRNTVLDKFSWENTVREIKLLLKSITK
jgi:glycosyltransferase involved in cell wall biosynthesis